MSFLKRLFQGGGAKTPEPVLYKGYSITPTPITEGTHFRISAQIEKEIDGTVKTHTLIRADTVGDNDSAKEASLEKARQVIDALGDGIFT